MATHADPIAVLVLAGDDYFDALLIVRKRNFERLPKDLINLLDALQGIERMKDLPDHILAAVILQYFCRVGDGSGCQLRQKLRYESFVRAMIANRKSLSQERRVLWFRRVLYKCVLRMQYTEFLRLRMEKSD